MSKISMSSKIFGTVLSHGMRGRMLTKSELQTLAEARDMEELVTRMKNTVYLDAFAKLSKPYTAEKIEGALREYMVNAYAKMVNVTGGSRILNAYFTKYITWNLKIVLKGKALGKSYEELLPKVNLRAEELVGRRDIIVKSLVAKNLEEAVAAVSGSEFGEDATKAATIYKEKGDLRIYDVLAILRGKFWNLSTNDINDLIVTTTSKVTRDTLQKMINAEKISDAIGELSNTVYDGIVPQGATNDIDAIMQLESGFEAIGLKRVIGSFRTMFSVGIMLAALKLMILEVRNLSAIASGIEQKVPTETIVSRLVRPE